jgi:subtilisin family serine protease
MSLYTSTLADAFRLKLPGQATLFDDPAQWGQDIVDLAAVSLGDSPSFIMPEANAAAAAPASAVGAGAAQGLNADIATKTYGVTGKGITIGILSDSFNLAGGYAADVARGDLNAGISILKEGPAGGHDEGRAMAELIHKIAPDAQIKFYSAFNGAADFANGITTLAAAGCNVIVDDVTYLNEPFYQQGGVISAAVSKVVAAGVDYFTSASNEGTNFYEAKFNGVKTALPGLSGSYYAENFGTSSAPVTMQSLTIAKGANTTLDLQWDQPFASVSPAHASANSLAMVLYDSNNHVVAYALTNDVGHDPDQILQFTNTTGGTGFKLAIFSNGGSVLPGQFKYIVYGQGTTINDPNAGKGSGTIIGHEEVAAANTVGAVAYSATNRFGGSNTVESFSSVGQGQFLYDANGNRLATPVTPGGVDFLATDGAATSVFNPFYGTSAAAPDAAAVAALMLQANKSLAPSQVTAILDSSAIKAVGPANSTGAGLIQAPTAVNLALNTKGTLTTSPVTALAQAGTAATPLASTLNTLATDPTVANDFYASLDLGGGIDASNISALPAGGPETLAVMNGMPNLLPFNPNPIFG